MSIEEEAPDTSNAEIRDLALNIKKPEENSGSNLWHYPKIEEEIKSFDQPTPQWDNHQENLNVEGGNSSSSRG